MSAALPRIDSCPRCGENVWFYYGPDPSLIQWTFWTDGRDTNQLGQPHAGYLRCCSSRNGFFFERDLSWEQTLAGLELLEKAVAGKATASPAEIQSAVGEARFPPVEQLYDAMQLLSRDLSDDEEVGLRINAWQLENDRIRHLRQPANHPLANVDVHFSAPAITSLRRLFDLLSESDESHRYYRAEIARELGVFDTAITLFDRTRFSRLQSYAERALQLARRGDRYVANLV